MKSFFVLLLLLSTSLLNAKVPPELEQVHYTSEDSILVCQILSQDSATSVAWVGRQFLGKAYVGHTLENETNECLTVNLRELDCMTFLETSVALAMTAEQLAGKQDKELNKKAFYLFCQNLQENRYRNGIVTDYTSRLHYTTEWIQNNAQRGRVNDLCQKYCPEYTTCPNVGIMSSNPNRFIELKEHPEFIEPIRTIEEKVNQLTPAYLPKSELPPSGKDWIQTGDLIGLITTQKGIDIAHVGIAIYENGELHLMHASLTQKKVVIDSRPLCMQIATPRYVGLRIWRIKQN